MPSMHLESDPDFREEDGFSDERPRPKTKKKKPQSARKTSGSVLLRAILSDDDETAVAKRPCPPDLPTLIGRHPMQFWFPGWLFKEIADSTWRLVTSKASHIFPTTLREDHYSHPGYVLREIGNYAVELCPLTTCRQNAPYIPAETRLESTGHPWPKDSYLVMAASSRV